MQGVRVSVQSVDRTFDILELVANHEGPLTLSQISDGIDLPKSTVHRLLKVLKDRNYIEKNGVEYRLGLAFIALCSGLLGSLELRTEARVYMKALAQKTNQVVFLAIRQDAEIVYIDKLQKRNDIRDYCFIGQRRPLYCTALGKSLLSGLSDAQIISLIDPRTMISHTEHTITDLESLICDIQKCRERGYSLDDEEVELGMRCVAAPIKDYRNEVIAAVSTSWDLDSYTTDVTEQNSTFVREAAYAISKRMGFRG
ncbi:MAG: IclR family transcriptional regulator [Spirochaetia bacterium]|nr:IclR family transcriptional regulator [Spirochaetia bacterium]